MAASYKTVEKIIEIMQKHIDKETFKKIVSELLEVEGNSSFKDTIKRIAKETYHDRK